MKCAVEKGSGLMVWDTQTQHGDCISLFSFFQNKESRLITLCVSSLLVS
jgi:hypothetical protein